MRRPPRRLARYRPDREGRHPAHRPLGPAGRVSLRRPQGDPAGREGLGRRQGDQKAVLHPVRYLACAPVRPARRWMTPCGRGRRLKGSGASSASGRLDGQGLADLWRWPTMGRSLRPSWRDHLVERGEDVHLRGRMRRLPSGPRRARARRSPAAPASSNTATASQPPCAWRRGGSDSPSRRMTTPRPPVDRAVGVHPLMDPSKTTTPRTASSIPAEGLVVDPDEGVTRLEPEEICGGARRGLVRLVRPGRGSHEQGDATDGSRRTAAGCRPAAARGRPFPAAGLASD